MITFYSTIYIIICIISYIIISYEYTNSYYIYLGNSKPSNFGKSMDCPPHHFHRVCLLDSELLVLIKLVGQIAFYHLSFSLFYSFFYLDLVTQLMQFVIALHCVYLELIPYLSLTFVQSFDLS